MMDYIHLLIILFHWLPQVNNTIELRRRHRKIDCTFTIFKLKKYFCYCTAIAFSAMMLQMFIYLVCHKWRRISCKNIVILHEFFQKYKCSTMVDMCTLLWSLFSLAFTFGVFLPGECLLICITWHARRFNESYIRKAYRVTVLLSSWCQQRKKQVA